MLLQCLFPVGLTAVLSADAEVHAVAPSLLHIIFYCKLVEQPETLTDLESKDTYFTSFLTTKAR